MNSFQTIRTLNELLTTLSRSLPVYLADAKPWTQHEDEKLRTSVQNLVADEERYAQRVAEAIVACGGRPDAGGFPDYFAAKNDLALTYLLPEIIALQERSQTVIERCAAQLEGDATLHALAEEVLGNTKGHLDILKALK
jgi:bacterioferritin (cytochrome b1)